LSNLRTRLAAVVVAVFAGLLTSTGPAAAIVSGGDATHPCPSHAFLHIDDDGVVDSECGAVLIQIDGPGGSDDITTVATTAHCLIGRAVT
jgi:hypothetical protein